MEELKQQMLEQLIGRALLAVDQWKSGMETTEGVVEVFNAISVVENL